MRKLIVSEFLSLDGVMQAPGGAEEDTEGGFRHGGWTVPFWHDEIGATFGELMQDVDAFLLGRKTYVIHGSAFEPLPAGDPFGDLMNAPAKYVVSKTLDKPIWRNTTVIRDHVVETVRNLKAGPGKTIITDGSHETGADPAGGRSGRRAAPAPLPTDPGRRKAAAPRRNPPEVQAEIGKTVSERRGEPPLRTRPLTPRRTSRRVR
jgi:dihydrofolate reductase